MHPLFRFSPALGVLTLGWFLTGCGDSGTAPAAGGGAAEGAPAGGTAGAATGGGPAGYIVAVIPKGTIHEFWRSIEAGARKAEQEMNAAGTKVQIIWKGPLREDDRDQQIQVVENFTSRKVSALVLAPLDSQALVKPVETAVGAGIPTVIIDSDLKTDKYVSFVATDNFHGGELGGEQLAKLIGGKGNVILLRYAVGSASTEAREAGFLAAIKKFPEIKIVSSDQYAGATRETSYQASQNLLNRYGRELNGVFAPCEPVAVGMAKALRDLGYAGGKVKMVGFDTGGQTVNDLRAGDIQGLVVQNPLRMGYEGVMTAIRHLKGEKVDKRLDTGVTLVTKDNMDQPAVKELLEPPLAKYLKQ